MVMLISLLYYLSENFVITGMQGHVRARARACACVCVCVCECALANSTKSLLRTLGHSAGSRKQDGHSLDKTHYKVPVPDSGTTLTPYLTL